MRPPWGKVSTSPTRSARCAFRIGWRLTRTLPAAHRAAARLRLLKNRAKKSHLSMRSAAPDESAPLPFAVMSPDTLDARELAQDGEGRRRVRGRGRGAVGAAVRPAPA